MMQNPLSNFIVSDVIAYKIETYNKHIHEQATHIIDKIKTQINSNPTSKYITITNSCDLKHPLFQDNIKLLKNNGFRIFNLKWWRKDNKASYLWKVISWENGDACIENCAKENDFSKYDCTEF